MKLRDIAERLHCSLEGDGDLDITRVAAIEQAQPGDLTFIANPKYQSQITTTRASAITLSFSLLGTAVFTSERSSKPVS